MKFWLLNTYTYDVTTGKVGNDSNDEDAVFLFIFAYSDTRSQNLGAQVDETQHTLVMVCLFFLPTITSRSGNQAMPIIKKNYHIFLSWAYGT